MLGHGIFFPVGAVEKVVCFSDKGEQNGGNTSPVAASPDHMYSVFLLSLRERSSAPCALICAQSRAFCNEKVVMRHPPITSGMDAVCFYYKAPLRGNKGFAEKVEDFMGFVNNAQKYWVVFCELV